MKSKATIWEGLPAVTDAEGELGAAADCDGNTLGRAEMVVAELTATGLLVLLVLVDTRSPERITVVVVVILPVLLVLALGATIENTADMVLIGTTAMLSL